MGDNTIQHSQGTGTKEYVCPCCGERWDGVTNRVATRPLNEDAVAFADNYVYKTCPRLKDPVTGKNRRITMASNDYLCRRKWMDAYLSYTKEKPCPQSPDECVTGCGEEKGSLIVSVTNKEGEPKEEAMVTIKGPESLTGKTDKSGTVEFHDVMSGLYMVLATKDEISDNGTVNVPSQTAVTLKLTLSKKWVPIQWVEYQDTYNVDPRPQGRGMVGSSDIVHEKSMWVPEDYVVIEDQRKGLEFETYAFPSGTATIERHNVTWGSPNMKTKLATISVYVKYISSIAAASFPDPDIKVPMVYYSWDEYPRNRHELMEKHRPGR